MPRPLSDDEIDRLDAFLARVEDGDIPDVEAMDGYFAAIACCPRMVMPSEYLPVLQEGRREDGDLVFDDLTEAQSFMDLVTRHYNDVLARLASKDVYLPLMLVDDDGGYRGNRWARGFLRGTWFQHDVWSALMEDEDHAGPLIPIMALAHEDDPDPEMRPFDEPIDDEMRKKLIVGAAAGVMQLYELLRGPYGRRFSSGDTAIGFGPKVGRNDPCPCGSGLKFKKCCGRERILH